MIEINKISLQYNNEKNGIYHEALKDVTFFVEKGERCLIIGPSGSGKSSLLYLICGLFLPTKGKINIAGREVKSPRNEVSLILQDFGLFPWKTVWENAELGLRLRDIQKNERESKTRKLLKKMGLEEHMHKYPTQLSGGQRQRVGIVRALTQEPEVLLMDEPFSALDALTREKLQELLLDIWRETKLTLLMVTHSIEEAVFLGEKIVVLSAQPGKVQRIINNPNSGKESFRKSAEYYQQCNFIRAVLEGVKA